MGSITIIIIGILFILVITSFYKFYKDLKKDDIDLKRSSISEKFNIIVGSLNNYCFENIGKYTDVDKRILKIYYGVSHQIVYLTYSTGILGIIWKYKYYQQEMIYENNIYDARNLQEIEQENITQNLINDFNSKLEVHKEKVNQSGIASKVIDDYMIKQGLASKEDIQIVRDFLDGN